MLYLKNKSLPQSTRIITSLIFCRSLYRSCRSLVHNSNFTSQKICHSRFYHDRIGKSVHNEFAKGHPSRQREFCKKTEVCGDRKCPKLCDEIDHGEIKSHWTHVYPSFGEKETHIKEVSTLISRKKKKRGLEVEYTEPLVLDKNQCKDLRESPDLTRMNDIDILEKWVIQELS